jgi:hypothetical protein
VVSLTEDTRKSTELQERDCLIRVSLIRAAIKLKIPLGSTSQLHLQTHHGKIFAQKKANARALAFQNDMCTA